MYILLLYNVIYYIRLGCLGRLFNSSSPVQQSNCSLYSQARRDGSQRHWSVCMWILRSDRCSASFVLNTSSMRSFLASWWWSCENQPPVGVDWVYMGLHAFTMGLHGFTMVNHGLAIRMAIWLDLLLGLPYDSVDFEEPRARIASSSMSLGSIQISDFSWKSWHLLTLRLLESFKMMDYSVLVGTLSEWGTAGRYRQRSISRSALDISVGDVWTHPMDQFTSVNTIYLSFCCFLI